MSFINDWVLLTLLFPAVLGLTRCHCGPLLPTRMSLASLGPEIFPLDTQVESVHVADMDGDGLNDIVLANNSRLQNPTSLQPNR